MVSKMFYPLQESKYDIICTTISTNSQEIHFCLVCANDTIYSMLYNPPLMVQLASISQTLI